jgi:hypothetical protein
MIDLAAITIAVFERLRTDAAGAAVRAALGAGADSVLHAEDLRVEGLGVRALPARPLVALRRGVAPQSQRVVYQPIYTWYCYDDPAIGYGRIEALPLLIAQAFATRLIVPASAVGAQDTGAIGAQLRDDRLKLLVITAPVVIGAV